MVFDDLNLIRGSLINNKYLSSVLLVRGELLSLVFQYFNALLSVINNNTTR